VQLAPGAKLAPDNETEDDPATAVGVVLQVLVKPLGVATTSPAGRLSVKEIALSVWFTLVLEMVKVRLVVPFNGIVAAPNAFAIVGGLMTSRFALEVEFAPVPAAVELMVTLLL
jgi:hypothetical protein